MKIEIEKLDENLIIDKAVSSVTSILLDSSRFQLQELLKKEVRNIFMKQIRDQLSDEIKQVMSELDIKTAIKDRIMKNDDRDYRKRSILDRLIEEEVYNLARDTLKHDLLDMANEIKAKIVGSISILLAADTAKYISNILVKEE